AASDTALVELQCEAAISLSGVFYATGRNRDYLTLADEQLEKYADLLPPAYVSGLWSSKGTAHFNRGEWRFAIDALRKARDLIDRTQASRRILLGGADQLIPTQAYFFRSLVLMGFIDEAVETTERFVQTIDQMYRPFDIVWALLVKCSLCALLGQDDMLLQAAAKIVEISERHGYTPRRGMVSYTGAWRARDWVRWIPASTMPAMDWRFGVVGTWYSGPQNKHACCLIFWCSLSVSTRH